LLSSYQSDLEISINFKQGERLNLDNLQCEEFPSGTYSDHFNISDLSSQCAYCYDYQPFICLGGPKRIPKTGFWRANNITEAFLRCPNNVSCLEGSIYKYNSKNCEYFYGEMKIIMEFKNKLDIIDYRGQYNVYHSAMRGSASARPSLAKIAMITYLFKKKIIMVLFRIVLFG
jgi:hypothetical protein